MPKTLDSYLADRALTRQLYLMRFSAGEKKKVLGRILVDIGVGSGRIRSSSVSALDTKLTIGV